MSVPTLPELRCTGLSHHTAPVEVRERFAVEDRHLDTRLGALLDTGLREAVVLSTCNRVEYYTFGPASQMLDQVFYGKQPSEGNPAVYRLEGQDAVRHLFAVVAGLDSMVIGETEIAGQTKKAYQHAVKANATGGFLNQLFQRAFAAAKAVRTHTRITRGPVSVGAAAVDLAEKIFGHLGERDVLILGAGETSEGVARSLQSRGVRSLIVSNRSHDRACELAALIGGQALHFDDWETACRDCDIVISSTAAPHWLVLEERMRDVMRHRPHRPLFAIDLAVPRDIEPGVGDIDGVYLYDMDALQRLADQALSERRQEAARGRDLIEKYVIAYLEWANSRPASAALSSAPGLNAASAESV